MTHFLENLISWTTHPLYSCSPNALFIAFNIARLVRRREWECCSCLSFTDRFWEEFYVKCRYLSQLCESIEKLKSSHSPALLKAWLLKRSRIYPHVTIFNQKRSSKRYANLCEKVACFKYYFLTWTSEMKAAIISPFTLPMVNHKQTRRRV